jgi:DNA replication protein DnaC
MDDNLDQLLKNLRLTKIHEILDDELARAAKTQASYTELLIRLFRAQYLWKQQRSMDYRIRNANLPERWTLETFPFKKQPGVRAKTIRELAELDFIPRAENLVLIGQTGVGKTGIATALLLKALENGYRGAFIKAQDLFDEMYSSLADRSSRKMLNRLVRLDLIVIDELGYLNLKPEQSNIFFKLMDERYRKKTTIITTNLNYDEWFTFLGNKKMVEALLDRLRHHCHTIRIDGPSLRSPELE